MRADPAAASLFYELDMKRYGMLRYHRYTAFSTTFSAPQLNLSRCVCL